ncbi:MAG: hypothetical protein DBX59_04495 [Bacillota bacterium]|nr:MAG: hypothetical protein DBX59_04495 [Bacillota bacterium]
MWAEICPIAIFKHKNQKSEDFKKWQKGSRDFKNNDVLRAMRKKIAQNSKMGYARKMDMRLKV